jgi:hypothetical protein
MGVKHANMDASISIDGFALAGDQSIGHFGVKAQHPITHNLQGNPPNLIRIAASSRQTAQSRPSIVPRTPIAPAIANLLQLATLNQKTSRMGIPYMNQQHEYLV